jgi:hypothetical protein
MTKKQIWRSLEYGGLRPFGVERDTALKTKQKQQELHKNKTFSAVI